MGCQKRPALGEAKYAQRGLKNDFATVKYVRVKLLNTGNMDHLNYH